MIDRGNPQNLGRLVRKTILLTIILPVLIFAQEQFRTGVYVTLPPDKDSLVNVQQISDMGPNTVISHSRYTNRDSLEMLIDNVIVFNAFSEADRIHHYTAGCYTRWEAEEDVGLNTKSPGIKHVFGNDGGTYWSSGTSISDSGKFLILGPDYVQDRKYKLWYNQDTIVYFVNFNMKIDGDLSADTAVCEIMVRYRLKGGAYDTLDSKTYYANDLTHGYLDYTLSYPLPESINDEPVEGGELIAGAYRSYSSDDPDGLQEPADAYGVQFTVKWLGHRNLYVDYIEVYDEGIWSDYLARPDTVRDRVIAYIDSGTTNTSYWYALDEPHSIDNYEPYRIIDSILADDSKPPLITAFYPGWDGLRNNEYSMERFLEKAQPQELMYDYYPFYYDVGTTEYTDAVCLEIQRSLLQEPYDHGFSRDSYYYVAQAFGFTPHCSESTDNVHQRKPTPAQLRAETMMALAHGAKGIFYWNYYSYAKYDSTCEVNLLIDAIVDSFGTPTNLYYTLRDTIFPRLNGDLGEGLFRINYTGDYISYKYNEGRFAPSPITLDYLTLPGLPPSVTTSLQAGLFSREGHSNDKYFFLVNLLTNANKSIIIKLTPPVGGFTNYRLRDYEGVFDTTFTSSPFYYTVSHLAGDGHLYEVAPVVEYGGKLIANETVSGTKTLNADMIIKSGITLTISGDYTIDADVTVYGDIVVADGGLLNISPGVNIHLYNDAAITVIGDMQAVGTSGDSIIFDGDSWGSIIFNGSDNSELSYAEIRNGDGIQILGGSDVLINHCLIEDCTDGIYIYYSEPIISYTQVIDPLHNGINADACGQWVILYNNQIFKSQSNPHYKGYQGLWLQNSTSEEIFQNDIKGFFFGLYAGGGSTALFGSVFYPYFIPNNRIDTCSYGIGVTYGAYLMAGSGNQYCSSSIYDIDSYDIFATNYGTAYAENNYWGGGAPNSLVDGTSFLDCDPYLTEDPWDEGGMKPIGGEEVENKGLTKMTMGFDDLMELIEGHRLERREQIIEAISLYKGLVLNNTAVEPALGRLLRIALKHNHPELLEYLYQKIANPGLIGQEVILRLKANLKTQTGDYQGAMAAYDELVGLNTGSYQMLSAKFSKLFLAINLVQDANLATEILGDITSYQIEEDELLMKLDLAQSLLEQLVSRGANQNMGKGKKDKTLLPDEFALYQNYPNPFNPVTTIKYDLPKASQVSLIIYDILGEKVTELVNQRQQAGRYEVQFDGSKLASGIYLYQISAGKYITTKKMMLIK